MISMIFTLNVIHRGTLLDRIYCVYQFIHDGLKTNAKLKYWEKKIREIDCGNAYRGEYHH